MTRRTPMRPVLRRFQPHVVNKKLLEGETILRNEKCDTHGAENCVQINALCSIELNSFVNHHR